MAASLRVSQSILRKKIFEQFGLICGTQSVRTAYWNKDWKPGKFPTTKEERDAAAKKYYMHPQDYKPYLDDGTGYGDYPKVDLVSAEGRDPYYNWDYPEYRRDYCEPMHVEFDMYGADRVNHNYSNPVSPNKQLAVFLTFVGVMAGLFILSEQYPTFLPAKPKQMPASGETHYTFETVE